MLRGQRVLSDVSSDRVIDARRREPHGFPSMRIRSALVSASLPLFIALVSFACDSSESAPAAVPDAAAPGFDASVPVPMPPVVVDVQPITDAGPDAATTVVTTLPRATGLGMDGMPLDDVQVDPHWTVKDANGVALTSYVQTDALGYPGYWQRPSTASKFISPFVDTVDPSGNGTFTYTTTFVLGPEVTIANVHLTIRYVTDNTMTAIAINGESLPLVVAGSYTTFESRTETAHFKSGTNTIAFTVGNSAGPTGMRVELDLVK